MGDWIKRNKLELQQQATKFSNGLVTYGTNLSLTAGEVTAFGTALTVYDNSLNDWELAIITANALGEKFKGDKTNISRLMRQYNQRMQSSPNITNQKRSEIGLPLPGSSTTVVPKTVTNVVATPFANGSVKLSWNRSGNAQTVVFLIESSDDSITWTYAGNTNKVNITLTGYAPGVTKFFRIIASREALTALPSNVVVIYPEGGESSLRIAA